MRKNKKNDKKKGRSAKRALLVLLLILCLTGAICMGGMAAMELMERKQGETFYSQLAVVATSAVQPAQSANAPLLETAAASSELQTAAPVRQTLENSASQIDFAALWESCPDVVGWISLEDSVIDYPVLQGEDNEFYLNHLADKSENTAGSIMMDQVNSGDFQDTINILHGHHMRNGSMFGRLSDYEDVEYYREHPIIRLYTPNGDYDVAVFAAYTVNGYTFGYPTSFEDEASFNIFIRKAVSATPYETDVDVQYGDRLLMLSTCAYSYSGERCIVLGKIMEPSIET